jgi:MFS family permease
MWELFAMYAWFSVFLSDALTAHGRSAMPMAAFATFAMFLAGGAGSWLSGMIADRWGRTRTTILMMAISGTCALFIGLFFASSSWLILGIGLAWGFTIVADSAQFSAMVTELADQAYVGTALTLQLAAGFTVTVATIWLIPFLETIVGWRWAFAVLVPGPAMGIAAIARLKSLPEASRIASGRG